jgi:hypothetical protein
MDGRLRALVVAFFDGKPVAALPENALNSTERSPAKDQGGPP